MQRGSRRWWISAALPFVAFALVGSAHQAAGSKTILDLQPFRQTQSIHIRSNAGRDGSATLINLNPAINAWYVLEVGWTGAAMRSYHLENSHPERQTLQLDEKHPSSLMISEGATVHACDLFAAGPPDLVEQGRGSPRIFSPLCESRIYLRNSAVGHRTGLEVMTEFFRDRVWGGESVIDLGHQLLADSNRQTGLLKVDVRTVAAIRSRLSGPLPALIDPAFADRVMAVPSLGISVTDAPGGSLAPGAWYDTGTPGSYVSVFQPGVIDPQILRSNTLARPLDTIEASSLCYLVAFDLDRFRLGYARGTEHPEVDWSEHITARMRDGQLPGPDGIGDIAPLVGTGLLPPDEVGRTVAAFTAGFKRAHGAFLTGDLSLVNHGSHYGFIENGVVFSKLQPGMATILVRADGGVEMKTWEEKDNALLPRIRFARQNGVPLEVTDPVSQSPVPGSLVTSWGPGNWSGSSDRKLRTMRSSVALQISGGKRYLVFAVFSSATPSAMARVFQAYRCQYAMLLDMNALEHTYFAFYRASGPALTVEYLMTGMREVDTNNSIGSRPVVRFIGYPDNRDFFYVMRRDEDRGRQ